MFALPSSAGGGAMVTFDPLIESSQFVMVEIEARI
jgi:hypothetical protein